MGALVRVGNSMLSRGFARTVVQHKRALAAPMVGAKMARDPWISDSAKTLAAAVRERRACQYASAMARKTGALPGDHSNFSAVWDETRSTVHFVIQGERRAWASYSIPAHVMAFDPDKDLLCLPAPDDEASTPCKNTIDMFDDMADACAALEMAFMVAAMERDFATARQ